MHPAIGSFLPELGKMVELFPGRMFKNQPATRPKQVPSENGFGNTLEFLHLIGRVSKDQVEAGTAIGKETEHIGTDGFQVFERKLPRGTVNKFIAFKVGINGNDFSSPAGSEFIGNAAGTRKQVDDFQSLEIEMVVQNIEQCLLGQISGRPHRQVARRTDDPALIFSGNYPHVFR